jgi:hypothetical protein
MAASWSPVRPRGSDVALIAERATRKAGTDALFNLI